MYLYQLIIPINLGLLRVKVACKEINFQKATLKVYCNLKGRHGGSVMPFLYKLKCDNLVYFVFQVVGDHKFHTECFSCGNCKRFLEEEDDYVLLERHRLIW